MIWLIGNKGMLGSDVEAYLKHKKLQYIVSDMDVDITDINALRNHVKNRNLSWIVNCSAYTAVDKAEDERDLAFRINADGIKNIAIIAREKNAKVIHLSTDYVFDGLTDDGYNEDDEIGPDTVYGESKLHGEQNLRDEWSNHFIIRISWLYGKNGNNFVHTMLRLFKDRDNVSVVNDQWGSPTLTTDVAAFIIHIITIDSAEYGIYHYSNEGKTCWFEFAKEIYRLSMKHGLLSNEVSIKPISTEQFPTKAKRPGNSYLFKQKTKNIFDISINNWIISLEEYISTLN